uniref:ion transporter n=1 Tax=Candidatus Electrothrix sp. TaxID=2170559 RepID=UPI004056519B
MDNLREIILKSDTRKGKLFDIVIQLLIAISLISFSLETLPDLGKKTYSILTMIENVIVVIFSIEYVLRIILTEKKTTYIFSFYGIIDLLAILPFYLSGTISFQSLRILRFIRLFRILKLTRYTDAISRIGKAIFIAKEELVLFSVVTLMLLYLSAVGIYHFEHAAQPENYTSLFDCLWWAVATLTTVGYGDIYPITIGGRLFTFLILMLGLGVVAVPTGIIASALSTVRKSE